MTDPAVSPSVPGTTPVVPRAPSAPAVPPGPLPELPIGIEEPHGGMWRELDATGVVAGA